MILCTRIKVMFIARMDDTERQKAHCLPPSKIVCLGDDKRVHEVLDLK